MGLSKLRSWWWTGRPGVLHHGVTKSRTWLSDWTGVDSNSCSLSQWCYPTISSSVAAFSCWPQSFTASGSFPMSQLFASGGQSIGASASVLPKNIQDWFPLGLTGLISPLSKEFSRQEYWSGNHSLLQGIFPTEGSNQGLLHCRQILYHLSHLGSLGSLEIEVIHFFLLRGVLRTLKVVPYAATNTQISQK